MIKFREPRISSKDEAENVSVFSIEPLDRGFGYTLGNSMRRVLLSSLPGAAITSIKVDGVSHEFSAIPGVREDLTDIILNIKKLVLRASLEESKTLKIKAKGPKKVTAADIEAPSDVEIVNPDLEIANLNAKGKLNMEMNVEIGRGYVSAERNKHPNLPVGIIPVDSIFTPIRRVSYTVEDTRVGQRTDFDKLILNVETNGSMPPKEAVSLAAKIVNEHMDFFIKQATREEEETIFVAEEEKKEKVLDTPIEDLDFSVRSYNCLRRQKVDTLQQLVECRESDLLSIRNFGAKSIKEVKEKLEELGLSLK